jgi:hypothetical protein
MTYVPKPLDIPEELRPQIETALIERVRLMVQAAENRDMSLAEYEAQLDGDIEYGSGRGPWPGSCRLHDPLSREIHTQVLAKFAAARPVIQVDAEQADKQLIEAAQRREAWLNTKLMAEQFDQIWKDCAYTILRDPTAILYVGWKQETRLISRTMYHDGETFDDMDEPVLLSEEMIDREQVYEEIEQTEEEVTYNGREYRVVDEANLYLYPSDASSIKQATATAERVRFTNEELIKGVRAYGYEEDQVKALLTQGPTHDQDGSDFLEARQERSGIETWGDDGLYVCFLYYGTLPVLLDGNGESRLPEDLQDVQVCAVVCPKASCVLKLARSIYDDKPYFSKSVYKVPNQFEGKGLMQLLRELQEEATANMRATIDGINLEMMPAQYATPSWIGRYANRYKHAPGAYIPRETAGDVEPVQWTRNSEMGLNIHGLVQSRAQNMVGSENYGKMPSKQRRVIEVQNVLSAVDAKYSFLLGNFSELLVDIAPWVVALELKFGDPQEMTLTYGGRQLTVTADDLRGKFLYSTPATKADSDPEVRIAMAKAKKDVVAEYMEAELQLTAAARPDLLARAWHAARNMIIEIDPNERMPENYIGPEPQMPQAPEEEILSPEMSGIPDIPGMGGVLEGIMPALPGLALNGAVA